MDLGASCEALLDADPARDDAMILVDGLDRQIGVASKTRVHVEGLLHRAFSVVLVRTGESGPEILLARRAEGKYHSAGLWANSCCSHPRDGEDTMAAAYRRVREELRCEAVGLRDIASFAYRTVFDGGLSEHEFDHVLVGKCEGAPDPEPTEVAEVRWVGAEDVADELARHPEHFAAWAPMVLSIALPEILK